MPNWLVKWCTLGDMTYLPRVADTVLSRRLQSAGAVLIEGAKGTGKTELARQASASEVRVDTDPQVPLLMESDPALVLRGETPRLLDEWQTQPTLWNFVRRAVDDRRASGQFILTGSATPDDDARRHSGVGRFSVMRLRPMSLWESGVSTGAVSLAEVRRGGDVAVPLGGLTLENLAEIVARGGWPATVNEDLGLALDYVADYLGLLAQDDISRVDGVRRDPMRVERLLASLARNTASEASIATIVRDLGDDSLDRDTVSSYLNALERLMVTDNQPAWSTALKDSATLRKAPKRHLVDPSLAAAAMRANPQRLLQEVKTLGNLVESLVIRDLRVYASVERGQVYHYRDSANREIDAIIDYGDGWIACEIKLGPGKADVAAENLKAVVSNIDTQTVGEPDALMVITGTGPGYRRPDGVVVVPVGALRD